MIPKIGSLWWDLREWGYGKLHHLQDVGSILRVGLGRYRGSPFTFLDGTVIRNGDLIGELHFHNRRISDFHVQRSNPGFRFVTEFERSLCGLASLAVTDPKYRGVKAWGGTGWWKPSWAKRVGFEPIEVSSSIRRFWLALDLRAILRHYGGGLPKRSIIPMDFWISTQELLRRYGVSNGLSSHGLP